MGRKVEPFGFPLCILRDFSLVLVGSVFLGVDLQAIDYGIFLVHLGAQLKLQTLRPKT